MAPKELVLALWRIIEMGSIQKAPAVRGGEKRAGKSARPKRS